MVVLSFCISLHFTAFRWIYISLLKVGVFKPNFIWCIISFILEYFTCRVGIPIVCASMLSLYIHTLNA